MKRNSWVYAVILIGLQLLVLREFFPPGVPQGHDTVNHIVRIAAYRSALLEGQIPPRWAGTLNYGYGTPVFTFFYPLPYMSAAIAAFLIPSYETVWKILVTGSFVAAGIFFFLWARLRVPPQHALLGSMVYSLAPYHILNASVRGDIGELFAYMLLPLAGLSSAIAAEKRHAGTTTLLAITLALLIMAHPAVALFGIPVIFTYMLCTAPAKGPALLRFVFAGTGALALSAFFWIPALTEQRYLMDNPSERTYYLSQFLDGMELFRYRWGFSDSVRGDDALSPQIGIIQLLAGAYAIWQIAIKKHRDASRILWVLVLIGAAYMTTRYSIVFWQAVPVLSKLQFPWRFIGLTTPAVGWLATAFPVKNPRLLIPSVAVATLAVIPLIGIKGREYHTNAWYEQFAGSTFYHGEATLIWTAGDPGRFPDSPVQVIAGEASVSAIRRTGREHTFTVSAETEATVLDNTLYYPGWTAWLDGKSVPVEFQDAHWRGLITFPVPKGNHAVRVAFMETKLRRTSDIISLTAWLSVPIVLFFALRNTKKPYA